MNKEEYTIIFGPRGAGKIRWFIDRQMEGERTMTNEFYKGMLHAMESAKSYAQVVKANYEKMAETIDAELSVYDQGGAAGMRKMIEYFDIFIDFLKGYGNNDDVSNNRRD